MITQLRPPVLDQLGLEDALHDHLDSVRQDSGLDVSIRIDLAERLDPALETVLYRVSQEALTNIVKHAGAAHVWVSLEEDGDGVTLEHPRRRRRLPARGGAYARPGRTPRADRDAGARGDRGRKLDARVRAGRGDGRPRRLRRTGARVPRRSLSRQVSARIPAVTAAARITTTSSGARNRSAIAAAATPASRASNTYR